MNPALLVALMALVAEPQAKKPPAKRTVEFKVEIEQDGKAVEIKDHEVYLHRGEFALLVTLPAKESVFVSASFDPALYEDAKAGRPFGTRFRSGIVGAEGDKNSEMDLYVSRAGNELLHYWWVPAEKDKDDTRFDALTPVGNGYRGRRTVRSYFLAGLDKPQPVAATRRPLYVVFVQGESAKEAPYAVAERRRDFLRVSFDTVPAAAKEAARGDFELALSSDKPMAEREAALQRLAKMGRAALAAMDAVAAEARIRASETAALAQLRALLAAETAYSSSNGGLFDKPECLESPSQCLPKYKGQPFLPYVEPNKGGYARAFHPGPSATKEAIKKGKASASSLTAFAYTAVPEQPGDSGERSFCGDWTGLVCALADGSAPVVAEGRCPGGCLPAE